MALQGRRRLLQGGPANNLGIATWTYSYGESVGLQYDPFALAGSVAAAPPLANNVQGKQFFSEKARLPSDPPASRLGYGVIFLLSKAGWTHGGINDCSELSKVCRVSHVVAPSTAHTAFKPSHAYKPCRRMTWQTRLESL